MTTKKKVGISDLLRDEVQKPSTSNEEITEKTIEVKAETVSEAVNKGSGLLAISADNQAKLKSSDSQADLVKAELVRSQKREPELLQMIADLQKDLQISQTNVDHLQKSLAALQSLKNELEHQLGEVKRDNLRLAEANIKLSEQAKAPETATITTVETTNASQPTPSQPTPSQLVSQSPPQNRATPRKQPVDQPYPNRDRTPYTRPTGSNEQLQRINNKNIGWMD